MTDDTTSGEAATTSPSGEASAPSPSDDALMRAFASGDVRAFEQLYARHRGALFRFVRRLLGRDLAAQADEVFQDTWLRVVDARARWSPQGASFRTWLFTLAHHRAVDCLRKSGREVSGVDSDDAPWEPAGAPWSSWPDAAIDAARGSAHDLAEQAFWRAAGQRLIDCLEELPVTQKSVFLLHHEDGLRMDELAGALQLGFETAKSRLRYAMAKLRTCMGAYLPVTTAERTP